MGVEVDTMSGIPSQTKGRFGSRGSLHRRRKPPIDALELRNRVETPGRSPSLSCLRFTGRVWACASCSAAGFDHLVRGGLAITLVPMAVPSQRSLLCPLSSSRERQIGFGRRRYATLNRAAISSYEGGSAKFAKGVRRSSSRLHCSRKSSWRSGARRHAPVRNSEIRAAARTQHDAGPSIC